MTLRRRVLPLLVLAGATTGCELTEVTTAQPEDVVIAEVVLRQGDRRQTAYLHRTTTGNDQRVRNAIIIVTEQGTGREMVFSMASDTVCLGNESALAVNLGTCYAVLGQTDMIRPAVQYTLRIELSDGRILTGTTRVPGDFQMVVPRTAACRLTPGTLIDLTWTKSAGASVYLATTRLIGIYQSLRASGFDIDGTNPVDLTGLSITAADTTMMFPRDFGVFDRFDSQLHKVLLAIREGLPPNVGVQLIVAAADNNYVNWVRGSNFNPSGLVRISSIQGDGRGVFGSLVPRDSELRTSPGGVLPSCQ